jgi:predicted nucleotide-binding protein (sugar kinase/HSP70/actin superfamily)
VAGERVSRPTVGIPRTLVHMLDFVEWRGFFERLGCKVVRSEPSTYATFQEGFRYASNEQCFPVKLFLGHVAELAGKSDYLFVPQYVSLAPATFSCPKVIGAPLLARKGVPGLQPMLMPAIDFSHPRATLARLLAMALRLTRDPRRLRDALGYVSAAMTEYTARGGARAVRPARSGRDLIGVIAHRYALRDPQLNMGLFRKLKAYGLDFVASDTLGTPAPDATPFDCPPIHWDFGQNVVHAAHEFMHDDRIKGVIFLTYFGCGPDSFLEEVFKKDLAAAKPFLSLSLDEHTGEAGVVTRLEAFVDMMRRERRLAS